MWSFLAIAAIARDTRDGTEFVPGMVTGRTRPLCSAAMRQRPSSLTAIMVCRDSRRLGSLERQGISTDPVAWITATSGRRYRMDST